MARLALTDYLQNFCFWLMDVAPIGQCAAPIFNPLLGFTAISAPNMNLENFSVREGNWYFERHIVRRASYGQFSMRRGATYSDSDFWRWAMAGLTGGTSFSVGGTYRRTFMLIHFFAHNPLVGIENSYLQGVSKGAFSIAQNVSKVAYGPFEFAARVPAKAYMLKGCVPLAWRSGGDFDATDGSVSIAELDFSCEMVQEISLAGSLSGIAGTAAGVAGSGIELLLTKLVGG